MTVTEKRARGADIKNYGVGLLVAGTATAVLKQAPIFQASFLLAAGVACCLIGSKWEARPWQ